MPISPEAFFLDPDAQGTLQLQIRQFVAQNILSGRFRAGERLPSSRALAQHLGISRITVTQAYTELVADEYLSSKDRSGYFVSEGFTRAQEPSKQLRQQDRVDWAAHLTPQFETTAPFRKPIDWKSFRYPFIYGQADPALFDLSNWRLCALQAHGMRDFTPLTLDYHDQDDPMLVEFMCDVLLPRRGILAKPDEILFTMGAQNGLWLTAQTLLQPGRRAVIENPGYPDLRDILGSTGATVDAISVDSQGLNPKSIRVDSDVVFVTPAHQSPTNVSMPLSRRRNLLSAANTRNMLIVEDDYEFAMATDQHPQPALKAMDTQGRVIYVGSFSKSIFPGLRLGYLVGPPAFIKAVRALRARVLRHPPGHIQRTTAYFLSRGHYDALIRRTARIFHARREIIVDAVGEFDLKMAGPSSNGGSSLWMEAPPSHDMTAMLPKLREAGVLIEPGAPFFAGENVPKQFYRLAYSSISANQILPGIAALASVMND